MKTVILGIDPGIADTGYGVICKDNDGKTTCLEYGSIKTPAGQDLAVRLETISLELEKIIDKHKPETVAVEELFFCNNAKTALIVGQARGVVLLTARKKRVKLLE